MVIKNVVGWMLAGVLVAGSVTLVHEPARRADRTADRPGRAEVSRAVQPFPGAHPDPVHGGC
mgnify:CR=1 FL=1